MDSKHFHLIHLAALAVLCIVPACLGIGQTQFPYSLWQPAEPYCPPEVEEDCDPEHEKYRRADGTCNNLQNPSYGAKEAPQIRYLPSAFDDGISSPRSTGVDGQPLEGTRFISTQLFRGNNPTDDRHTTWVMQWGQFLDHDVTRTEIQQGLDCCDMNNGENRPECLPIPVPVGDPFFMSQRCIDFRRSVPADTNGCSETRQFPNVVTTWVDGSAVYGSDKEAQESLRDETKRELLKISDNNQLPPDMPSQCQASHPTTFCFKAGDRERCNEQPGLTTIHTIWVREHNRIAKELKQKNLHWNDERVFQETRKIIIALIQHITYREFLRIVLSQDTILKYKLKEGPNKYHYTPSINPALLLSVSTAVLRFGHSMVPGMLDTVDLHYKLIEKINLTSEFNDPKFLQSDAMNHYDELGRGLTDQRVKKLDRQIDPALLDQLFVNNLDGKSLDLAALNLQRGRDHGLPEYNQFRKLCSLSVGDDFDNLPDQSEENQKSLGKAYRNVGDIDLFAGGLLETPEGTGLLGPTFDCLLGYQFALLKQGDRFFWETKNRKIGFTRAQRRSIRKVRLSKILCNNLEIKKIQRNAFKAPSNRNKRKSCSKLRDLDLDLWKEEDPNSESNSSSSSDSSSSSSSDSSVEHY